MREEGLEVLAWRVVPTNPDGLGLQALASMPSFKTLIIADPEGKLGGIELDRKTFRIRKRVEHEVGIYFASLSPAPSPTRACSPPCSSSPSSLTCPTNA